MQLVRRLALVAALALVGGIALSGCRSEPGVAAYVGDKKITVDQVDAVVDVLGKINATRSENAKAPAGKQFIVSLMVYSEVAQRVLTEKNLTAGSTQAKVVSDSFGVPLDSPYTQLFGTYLDRFVAVRKAAGDTTPSREQIMRYYQAGVDANLYPAGIAEANVVSTLSGQPEVKADLAAQALLDDTAKKQHLQVNPRFAPLPLPVIYASQQGRTLNTLPFAPSGDSFVTEAH